MQQAGEYRVPAILHTFQGTAPRTWRL